MYYADELLTSSDSKKIEFTDTIQGTLTGSLIGLVGGTLFAYFQKKDYVTCMIVGTIGVGLISRILLINNN